MARFLLFLLAGAVALALAPALIDSGNGWLLALGILLMFFVIPGISKVLAGTILDSGLGFVALLAVGGFFLANQRSCANIPVPSGDPGKITEIGRIGYLAEGAYDRCLDDHIRSESENGPLAAAAKRCQSAADDSVAGCMERVQDQWWTLDKAGVCRDAASRDAWRPCAQKALGEYHPDALGACQGQTVRTSLLREFAGFLSGQSGSAAGSTQAAGSSPAYDTACLANTFNRNLGYMPDLQCNQYTSRVFDSGSQQPRVEIDDEAAYQNCLVQSIVKGMGETGVQLVQRCQAAR